MHLAVQAGEDGDDRGDDPQGQGPGPEAPEGLGGGTAPGGLATEEDLPAPRVLLSSQQPRTGEQPPHRAEDHQGHRDLEDGEPGDGLELGRRPEQRAHRLVRAVGGGQGISLGLGLVNGGVADGRRGDGNAEDVAPDDAGPNGLACGHAGNDEARCPPGSRQGRGRGRDRQVSLQPGPPGPPAPAILRQEQLFQ